MNKAAFYDLDGTLLSCNLVTMHAYYARNDRSLVKSVYQFTKVVLSVPLLFGLDLYSRSLFNVFSFRAYRGMHRDRLIGLADDLFEVTLKPSIFPQAKALIDCTRDLGYRNVLVTGTLDFTIRPIALHFGFDEVICNRLEFKNHVATGRVLHAAACRERKSQKHSRVCGAGRHRSGAVVRVFRQLGRRADVVRCRPSGRDEPHAPASPHRSAKQLADSRASREFVDVSRLS